MKKNILFTASLLALSACANTSPQKVATSQSSNLTNQKPATSAFVYTPGDREEFVFGEMLEGLQKFGYGDLCFKMPTRSYANDCILNKLPYEKYVGKRGYYTDRKPFIDYSGYVAKEAILETGETIYLVTSNKFKHVGDKIISLAEHEKISNFQPVPIYEGSSVLLTGYSKISKGYLNVSSQNKHSYNETQIKKIRDIASRYPKNGQKIADLLSTLKIDYDDFEGRTVVSWMPYNNPKSYLSIKFIWVCGNK